MSVEHLDWSFRGKKNTILRKGKHPYSNFRRAILDGADLTEGEFEGSDFSHTSMVGADLMKGDFEDCDFRGADLRKAKMNLANFRNCLFDGADIRGIRGRYAIWKGANWWDAKHDDELGKILEKKWGRKHSGIE